MRFGNNQNIMQHLQSQIHSGFSLSQARFYLFCSVSGQMTCHSNKAELSSLRVPHREYSNNGLKRNPSSFPQRHFLIFPYHMAFLQWYKTSVVATITLLRRNNLHLYEVKTSDSLTSLLNPFLGIVTPTSIHFIYSETAGVPTAVTLEIQHYNNYFVAIFLL